MHPKIQHQEMLCGCHFQVISGNAPQMTEANWQRTSKYESTFQSPPQNTILAAGNAPETIERTSNHTPSCPANTQLEHVSGEAALGEGKR